MSTKIQGRRPEPKSTRTDYIHERVTRPWIYVHDPMGWFFEDTVGWLPLLGEISLTPGCNGVTSDDAGHVDANGPIAVMETNGFTVIRPYDKRLKDDYRPYYLEYDCIEGSGGRGKVGIHHRSVFEQAVRIGTRTMWRRDDSAWHDFLLSLVSSGLVEPMAPEVLELNIDLQHRRIDRAAKQATNPYFKQIMEAEQVRLTAMVENFDRQFSNLTTTLESPEAPEEMVIEPVNVVGRKPAADDQPPVRRESRRK